MTHGEIRGEQEVLEMFMEKVSLFKTPQEVIEECVPNEKMKDTIVLWNAGNIYKNDIKNMAIKLAEEGAPTVIAGFENTVRLLEDFFRK